MPLLERLALPRFYVQGDQAVVSAIVQNYTGDVPHRPCHAYAPSGATQSPGTRPARSQIAAGGQERLDWRAQIASGAQNARFTVTADGGAGAQDATETTLPVSVPGLKMVTASAVTLTDPSATDTFDLSALPPGATVTLTLSPSLASALFPALDYLTSYPYGCAEQTMSSFLPDIAVAAALKQRGGNTLPPATLTKQVNLGLQKLYRYQHGDGGWNWWEFDQTDGDMTAYVLSGLVQARQAGYLVDDQRILRGAGCLKSLLAGEQELSKRADWALALSEAQPGSAGQDTRRPVRQARPSGHLQPGVSVPCAGRDRPSGTDSHSARRTGIKSP